MITKFFTLCMAGMLAFFSANAQLAKIKWGAEGRESKLNFYPYLLGHHDDAYYVLRLRKTGTLGMKIMRGGESKNKAALVLLGFARFRSDAKLSDPEAYMSHNSTVFIEKISNDLKLLSSKEFIQPDVKGEDFLLKNAFLIGGKIYLFSTTWYKKEEKTVARLHEVNTDGQIVKSIDVSTVKGKSDENKSDENTFDVVKSEDGNYLVVYHSEQPEIGKNATMEAVVYDSGMQEKWRKTYTANTKDEIALMKLVIDAKGTVYALNQVFYDKAEAKKHDQKFYYSLNFMGGANANLAEYKLDLGAETYVSDVQFFQDPNDDILLTGFYSLKSANKIKGFYSRTLKYGSLSEAGQNQVEFGADLFSVMLGAKKGAKAKELSDLHIRYMFPNDDGTVTYIAEKFYIDATQNNSNSTGMLVAQAVTGTAFSFEYNYEDLLVMNIAPGGKLNWSKKVVKWQVTLNDGALYSSFIAKKAGDKIFLVYNANRNDPNDRMSNTNKAVAYVTSIDKNGETQTDKLFSAKEEGYIMTPRISFKHKDNRILMHNIKDGDYAYSEITF